MSAKFIWHPISAIVWTVEHCLIYQSNIWEVYRKTNNKNKNVERRIFGRTEYYIFTLVLMGSATDSHSLLYMRSHRIGNITYSSMFLSPSIMLLLYICFIVNLLTIDVHLEVDLGMNNTHSGSRKVYTRSL